MTSCPLCGAPARAVGRREGFEYWECRPCGFRFVSPEASRPAPFERDYFESDAGEYGDYAAEEHSHRRAARRHLARLRRAGLATGRLLEVGCAAGFFLDEARRAGWEVSGVELSAWAVDRARGRRGLSVVNAPFLEAPLDPAGYDLVVLLDALECLEGPRAVEGRLWEVVRPGGHVAIETWDWTSPAARLMGMSWHQYSPRYLRCLYSRRALHALFPSPRWHLRTIATATKWVSAARALDVLSCRYGVRWPRPWIEAARHVPVPYRLGDLLWVVVRRES
jgi:SAM-dependent methyltransferase